MPCRCAFRRCRCYCCCCLPPLRRHFSMPLFDVFMLMPLEMLMAIIRLPLMPLRRRRCCFRHYFRRALFCRHFAALRLRAVYAAEKAAAFFHAHIRCHIRQMITPLSDALRHMLRCLLHFARCRLMPHTLSHIFADFFAFTICYHYADAARLLIFHAAAMFKMLFCRCYRLRHASP